MSAVTNETWATVGHLPTLSVPGVGHLPFYHGPGVGHLRTPGRLRVFDTCGLKTVCIRDGGVYTCWPRCELHCRLASPSKTRETRGCF